MLVGLNSSGPKAIKDGISGIIPHYTKNAKAKKMLVEAKRPMSSNTEDGNYMKQQDYPISPSKTEKNRPLRPMMVVEATKQ